MGPDWRISDQVVGWIVIYTPGDGSCHIQQEFLWRARENDLTHAIGKTIKPILK
jgi:hypothetical protein